MRRAVGTLAVAAVLAAGAGPAGAQLAFVSGNPPQGPGGDNNLVTLMAPQGIPIWYEDIQGLRLELCPGGDPNCISDPIEAGDPQSELLQLGAEGFYYVADAGVTLPNGGTASLRLNLETAFANEVIQPGDQVVFSRIRIRILGGLPNATYTFVHPYGTSLVADGVTVTEITTDELGNATVTEDVPPFIPGDWVGALSGTIGPNFLVAVDPPPPPGYIGNPLREQTVTGSTFPDPANPGQMANLFRITGPDGTVETNLFTVQGKICTVCGPNVAPVAVDDAAGTAAGTPVTIAVTANDLGGDPADPAFEAANDVPLNPASVAVATQPVNGTAQANLDGTVTYTPNPGFAGVDTFTYTVADFAGLVSAPATVTVTVERIEVARSVYRPKLTRWEIRGTSSIPGPGNQITVRAGSAGGPVIGVAEVGADGSWILQRDALVLPDGTRTVTLTSTIGATVAGVAVDLR